MMATLVGGLLSATAPVSAQVVPRSVDDVVSVTALEGWHTEDGRFVAAIAFDLEPGWKTYWRSSGDTGVPTQITWQGTGDLADIEIHWPRPQVFREYGMRSLGYTGQVVLPVILSPTTRDPSTHGPISVSAQINYAVCNEICLPASASLELTLSQEAVTPHAQITQALEAMPKPATDLGLAAMECALTEGSDGSALHTQMTVPTLSGRGETVVFEYGGEGYWLHEPDVERTGDVVTVVAKAEALGGAAPFDPAMLRATVLTTTDAVVFEGCR